MTYRHLSPATAGKVTGRAPIPTSPFPRYAATYVNSPSLSIPSSSSCHRSAASKIEIAYGNEGVICFGCASRIAPYAARADEFPAKLEYDCYVQVRGTQSCEPKRLPAILLR